MKQGYLVLETGEVFPGNIIGNFKGSTGEIVFNTSMTGYQEIMTDPSYAGQIVVFSYPLIGNYGINEEDYESWKPHVAGIVTGELCAIPSHYKLAETAESILAKFQIPCITNVDTRALVKTIRKRGTVNAVISDKPSEEIPSGTQNIHLVSKVATTKVKTFNNSGPHVVLLDFGYKKSILSYLLWAQCKVTVVPYNYEFEQISELEPDAIVLSNGPGDPAALIDQLAKIKKLTENYPTLGICLGHQLVALAYGAKTEKLPFGHRGGNHPVKDLKSGKVFITSQNHGYVVIDQSIDREQFDVSFKHVNDGTVEGLVHKTFPLITVQFHPEAHPGPQDTKYIFEQFIQSIKGNVGVKTYAIR